MKKNINDLWTKALRSDQYEQGTHCLKNENNEYCCLGVLCDLYRKEKNLEWQGDGRSNSIIFLDEEYYLPREVVEWSGLKDYKASGAKP